MGFIRVNDLAGWTHVLEAMLDTLPSLEPTSHLSCQPIWGKHLDGLELGLAGA